MPEVTFRIGRVALARVLAECAGFDTLDAEWLRGAEAAGLPLAEYERPFWDDASETYRLASGAEQIPPEDAAGEVLLEVTTDGDPLGERTRVEAFGRAERVRREKTGRLRRRVREVRWSEPRHDCTGARFDHPDDARPMDVLQHRALLVPAAPAIRELARRWNAFLYLTLSGSAEASVLARDPSRDWTAPWVLPGREILDPEEREALRRVLTEEAR